MAELCSKSATRCSISYLYVQYPVGRHLGTRIKRDRIFGTVWLDVYFTVTSLFKRCAFGFLYKCSMRRYLRSPLGRHHKQWHERYGILGGKRYVVLVPNSNMHQRHAFGILYQKCLCCLMYPAMGRDD